MTPEEIRRVVLGALKQVAPEANTDEVPRGADIRDELDIDSMDFNKFVLLLHDALRVDIPEKDYPKFFTIDGSVRELEARLRSRNT